MFLSAFFESIPLMYIRYLLLVLWSHRYIRLIVNTISHWTYKSKPIPEKPSYTVKDVTVIIPTISSDFEELREPLHSILLCQPYEVLMVTTMDKFDKLNAFVKSFEASNIRTFQVAIANKRVQVCEAIPEVKTSFIVMADDDVEWPKTILPWLLAPFEDAEIGAVGPNQRVKRVRNGNLSETLWNWLNACYIERRNFEISATHGLDGGTSCMSGRTCAFRAEILQSPLFLEGFKTERWGQYHLNADDDNFVTRWLVSKGWKTWIQYSPECEIETTLENNHKYILQCLRWARSNWRSNYTSAVIERHVWSRQPWSSYALHLATPTSLAFFFDWLILRLVWEAGRGLPGHWQYYFFYAQIAFLSWSKVIKLVGLFRRHPIDIIYLPVSFLFGQFHGLIKIYALFTLNTTSWGSRVDGDTNDSARMAPRGRRSESIVLPAGHHPILVRYSDEKDFVIAYEKQVEIDEDEVDDEDGDASDYEDSDATSSYSNENTLLATPPLYMKGFPGR